MFTPYLVFEDCNYELDSTGKGSYKLINCKWKTTMFLPCSALNNSNENFSEHTAPSPWQQRSCSGSMGEDICPSLAMPKSVTRLISEEVTVDPKFSQVLTLHCGGNNQKMARLTRLFCLWIPSRKTKMPVTSKHFHFYLHYPAVKIFCTSYHFSCCIHCANSCHTFLQMDLAGDTNSVSANLLSW